MPDARAVGVGAREQTLRSIAPWVWSQRSATRRHHCADRSTKHPLVGASASAIRWDPKHSTRAQTKEKTMVLEKSSRKDRFQNSQTFCKMFFGRSFAQVFYVDAYHQRLDVVVQKMHKFYTQSNRKQLCRQTGVLKNNKVSAGRYECTHSKRTPAPLLTPNTVAEHD